MKAEHLYTLLVNWLVAEFQDLTVEKRSAISIARRLQDPLWLSWLRLILKSIGVGQYQHDVSQKKLSESLDFVVDTVVNKVGHYQHR